MAMIARYDSIKGNVACSFPSITIAGNRLIIRAIVTFPEDTIGNVADQYLSKGIVGNRFPSIAHN